MMISVGNYHISHICAYGRKSLPKRDQYDKLPMGIIIRERLCETHTFNSRITLSLFTITTRAASTIFHLFYGNFAANHTHCMTKPGPVARVRKCICCCLELSRGTSSEYRQGDPSDAARAKESINWRHLCTFNEMVRIYVYYMSDHKMKHLPDLFFLVFPFCVFWVLSLTSALLLPFALLLTLST